MRGGAGPVLVLNGTVGAGKSSTMAALGALLRAGSTPHALIDLDELRRAWPPPADDPFHERLAAGNLAAVAAGHRGAGATVLVVAAVVESATQRAALAEAVGPCWSCRLTVATAEGERRLRQRHPIGSDELAWHLARGPELDAVLARAATDDLVLDTTGRAPDEVASSVLAAYLGA